jgi:hypothetical protein
MSNWKLIECRGRYAGSASTTDSEPLVLHKFTANLHSEQIDLLVIYQRCFNSSGYTGGQDLVRASHVLLTAYVVQWSEFLATDPEVPGSIPGATRF